MPRNISKKLPQIFIGSLVNSDNLHVTESTVAVTSLNDLLVKISFYLDEEEVVFRAMLSEQKEGVLMLIKDRVTDKYILSGQSGFLYRKPNIHGGFINLLNSFYFHVKMEHYNGVKREIYFLGKDAEDRANYLENKQFHMTLSA